MKLFLILFLGTLSFAAVAESCQYYAEPDTVTIKKKSEPLNGNNELRITLGLMNSEGYINDFSHSIDVDVSQLNTPTKIISDNKLYPLGKHDTNKILEAQVYEIDAFFRDHLMEFQSKYIKGVAFNKSANIHGFPLSGKVYFENAAIKLEVNIYKDCE